MRIALISSSSGSRGGGELYLCGLARGLVEQGHEVVSVLARHGRMDELAAQLLEFGPVRRIEYINTYDRKLRSVGAVLARREIRRLTRELSELPVDLLHVNKQNLEDGLDLLIAAERTGRPAVATVHVTRTMRGLKSLGAGLRDFVAARVLRGSSLPLIAIAQSCLHDLAALGIPVTRRNLAWNGVSAAPVADREQLRAGWQCSPEDLVLGCVARIEPQKNPLFLPALLARLPRRVRLVWVGDGSLRSPMEQAIADAGVADRVVLTGWQHQARTLMAGFDVFVLPSLYEGFPFAILEAMAAGLPCVVSDVDGVAEAVIHQQTGYVCAVNDAAAWQAALQCCLDMPETLRDMGQCGREHYRQHFSIEAMARQTVSVYESVLAAATARPSVASRP